MESPSNKLFNVWCKSCQKYCYRNCRILGINTTLKNHIHENYKELHQYPAWSSIPIRNKSLWNDYTQYLTMDLFTSTSFRHHCIIDAWRWCYKAVVYPLKIYFQLRSIRQKAQFQDLESEFHFSGILFVLTLTFKNECLWCCLLKRVWTFKCSFGTANWSVGNGTSKACTAIFAS